MSDLPRIIGHRGAKGHAPENTIASLRAAAAMGVRWVEFDAKLTHDGEVIVMHDETLDRTTDGTGAVADMDWVAIARLDAGGWFAGAFAGERVPTLRAAIAALAELGLGANVEIKPCPGRAAATGSAVAAILAAEWPATVPPPLLSSFAPDALAAARAARPSLTRALLVDGIPDDWAAQLDALGCAALHCDQQHLTRAQARGVVAAGVPLRCYTVNARDRAETLFAWGVGSVFTDFPDRMPALPAPDAG